MSHSYTNRCFELGNEAGKAGKDKEYMAEDQDLSNALLTTEDLLIRVTYMSAWLEGFKFGRYAFENDNEH